MAGDLVLTDKQTELATELVKVGHDTGRYVADVLGDLPKDLIAYAFGDRIKAKRAETQAKLIHDVRERLRKRGIPNPEPLSLSVGLPLLEAAADESREELRSLWERLLANAMDPERKGQFRREFVDTVKQLDPIDTLVLQNLLDLPGSVQPTIRGYIAQRLQAEENSVEVSLLHLVKVSCVYDRENKANPVSIASAGLTPYGRQLLRAVRE